MERHRAGGGANAGNIASQAQKHERRGDSEEEMLNFSNVDDSELCKSNNIKILF